MTYLSHPASLHAQGTQDAVALLRTAGTYKNFLALADSAGLLPLLQGTVRDTLTPVVHFIGEEKDGITAGELFPNLPQGKTFTVEELKESVAAQGNTISAKTGEKVLAMAKAKQNGDARVERGFITVVAPTDDAFTKLNKATRDSLTRTPETRRAFIRAHIVNAGIASDVLPQTTQLTTLSGATLEVHASGDSVTIAGAHILTHDLVAKNGYVYGVDAILQAKQ